MSSSFFYFSSFDDDDVICFLDGLESMSDDDDGSIFEEGIESFGDLFFGEGVECTCWFIQKDDFWVFEKYLGNGETLFLSSGESHSSFSYFGIHSFFQIKYKVTVSELESVSEFLLSGIFCGIFREVIVFTVSDGTHKIFSNGGIKDTWFLGEISYVRIVGFKCCLIESVSENRDVSFIGVKVSCDEFHECRFASSTGTDESGLFSFLDGEGEVLEDRSISIGVGERMDIYGKIFLSKGSSLFISSYRE